MSKYIIAFLTVNPSKLFLEFIKKLKKPNYDIYVIIDDNDYKIDDIYNNINFIYINNYESEKLGFKGSLFKKNNIACSRDKALYYFSHKVTNYDYIWLIEEDVFIIVCTEFIKCRVLFLAYNRFRNFTFNYALFIFNWGNNCQIIVNLSCKLSLVNYIFIFLIAPVLVTCIIVTNIILETICVIS